VLPRLLSKGKNIQKFLAGGLFAPIAFDLPSGAPAQNERG
jgi:hypothetical protein